MVILQLDFRVTWRKLKDVFKLAGSAMKADIKVDKDGKSRGMGTVQFETPLEAVQAICILSYLSAFQAASICKYTNTYHNHCSLCGKLTTGMPFPTICFVIFIFYTLLFQFFC